MPDAIAVKGNPYPGLDAAYDSSRGEVAYDHGLRGDAHVEEGQVGG